MWQRGKGNVNMQIEIEEEQRQVILLALAHLAVERPGWLLFLRETALTMDEQHMCLPKMFTEFHHIRQEVVRDSLPEEPTPEALNKALAKHDENVPV